MRTIAEIRHGVARRLWALASGYEWPAAPPPPPDQRSALPRSALAHHPMWGDGDHPKRWELPEWIDRPECAWTRALKDLYALPMSFPASLSAEAGLLLHALVRNIRPRTVIETGTFLGISTIWMAAALAEGASLHAFDLFLPIRRDKWHADQQLSGRIEFVQAALARAGLAGRVHLHAGNSSFEIRRMQDELRAAGGGRGVQLAYIDGDHTIDGAWLDFLAVEPVLSTGGYVILHDVFPEYSGYDGPRHVVDHLRERATGTYETCDLCLAPVNHGLTVMRRVG